MENTLGQQVTLAPRWTQNLPNSFKKTKEGELTKERFKINRMNPKDQTWKTKKRLITLRL